MDPFIGEIRPFAFSFAPKGWAFCQGQLMPISQNTALFSLLGTYYGGDGKSNFALPDLQGSALVGTGQGPGLSQYSLGQAGGVPTVTLLTSEMPVHNHTASYASSTADSTTPVNHALCHAPMYYQTQPGSTQMQPLQVFGGGFPHNNMQPYLAINFCIALQGVFPPRG